MPQGIAQILAAAKGDEHALLAAVHTPWDTMEQDIREAAKSAELSLRLFEKFEIGPTRASMKFARWFELVQDHFRTKYGDEHGKTVATRTLAIIFARQVRQNFS